MKTQQKQEQQTQKHNTTPPSKIKEKHKNTK